MNEESFSWPDVDVIVPTYKHEEMLIRCLTALELQTYPGRYNIVVVDNSPTFSLDHLKSRFSEVTFDCEPSPGSYHARNKALLSTSSPVLAFTDSDCRPEPQWLERGVRALFDSKAAFVGGQVRLITESTQFSAAELYDYVSGFPQERFVNQVHFAMTANMFTTRKVFDEVGLFNGAQKSGGDREWGNRVWRAGGKGYYCHDAVVDHPTRGNASAVLLRVRRVAGGARDKQPGWKNCATFCLRHALPPRQAILDIWRIRDARAKLQSKVAATLFALYVRFVFIQERLRLQLFNGVAERC